MWDFSETIDDFYLVDEMNRRRETCVRCKVSESSYPFLSSKSSMKGLTPMNAKDLIINDSRQSEKVKHVGKISPDICITVFACAFSVKAISLGEDIESIFCATFEIGQTPLT